MEVWGPWPLWLSNAFILIWIPRETLVLKSRAISFQLNSRWIQHSMQIKLCPFKPKAKKPSLFYVSELPKYIYLFGGDYSDLWYHCQFHYQIISRHKWVIVLQVHSHLTNGFIVFAQGIVWFVIENIKDADYARYADYRTNHEESYELPRNYSKLAMLSFLYCFVVKGKLIWAKSLPAVRFEPATPTP